MNVISREKLIEEMREYAKTLELVATVKSAPIAAAQACEELPMVLAFLAQLEALPVASKKAPKVRCTWYRDIRRAYAIAREAGLDTKADAAMRAAFSRYLGRDVPSRETLDGDDWFRVGDAMKAGMLTW
jgi:hypothetical protein